jgi:hypothetical protein
VNATSRDSNNPSSTKGKFCEYPHNIGYEQAAKRGLISVD